MQLRPYQEEALKRLDTTFHGSETSAVLVMPTGSGKTKTAVTWALRRFSRILWLTHRWELLEQARETFREFGEEPALWCQDNKAIDHVTIAMVQSSRGLTGHFDLIVIDEAHHAAAPSYEAVLRHVSHNFKLGLTATPARLDKKKLDFGTIIEPASFADLIKEGFLSIPNYVRIETGQRHRLHVRDGDFTSLSLRELDNDTRNRLIAETWKGGNWGKTLVFAADIEHACHLLDEFRKVPPILGLTAEVIHSKMPAEHRRNVVEEFRETKNPTALINVGIFVEGFDVPDIRTLFLARPTASECLFLQMVGRGSRTAPNKASFHVVDFVDDLGKMNLLAKKWAVEYLGAKELKKDIDLANDIAEAVRIAEEAELPKSEISRIRKEYVQFAGVVSWKSNFGSGGTILASTDFLDSWLKLQLLLGSQQSCSAPELIESSFALCTVAPEMAFRAWKDFAWAAWRDRNHRSTEMQVKWTLFKAKNCLMTAAQMKDLLNEIDTTRVRLSIENRDYGGSYADRQMLVLNDLIEWNCRYKDFIDYASFKDRVLRVTSRYTRASIPGRFRSMIRQLLVDRYAPIEGDVELVLKWRDALLS